MEMRNVLKASKRAGVAAFCWRTLLMTLCVLMLSSKVVADNVVPVTQIEEGKWYIISKSNSSYVDDPLVCTGIGHRLEAAYNANICSRAWTFEKTDDGHYYVHNFLNAYIANYVTSQYNRNPNEIILSGAKSEAVKLDVTFENDKLLLQNVEDSTYLEFNSPNSYKWAKEKSSLLLSDVNTTYCRSNIYASCQLQVGECLSLTDVYGGGFYGGPQLQYKWTSNDETIATVNQYGEVTGVKEGDVIVWYVDSASGTTGFTKVTVKNNPCEHEYDPEHDIMAKFVGSPLQFFGIGYVQFYNNKSFDIYIDGVKQENINTTNLTSHNVDVGEFPPFFNTEYTGVHTMIIAPKGGYFTNLPPKLFYYVYNVGDDNIISDPNLVELRLPATLTEIGDYNGYGCEHLKDIYYYGNNLNPTTHSTDPRVFCDSSQSENFDESSICGRYVIGEKRLHIKSDVFLSSYTFGDLYGIDSQKCDFRLQGIDKPEQKIWLEGADSHQILIGAKVYASWLQDCEPNYYKLIYQVADPEILSEDPTNSLCYIGQKVGSTTVSICFPDSSHVLKTVTVDVVDDLNPIKVNTVTITPSELTLYPNETATLSVTYTPEDAGQKNVKWASSDISVAMVSNGVVAGLKEGTCTITATATDGGGAVGECKVTVKKPSALDEIISDACEPEIWYNLQGIKLPGRPTESGLYICNGKKVVVK